MTEVRKRSCSVEVGAGKAVPWTKPEDLTYDPKDPVSSLGDIGDFFTILFADGSVFRLKSTIDASTLNNLFRRNDGNAVNLEQISQVSEPSLSNLRPRKLRSYSWKLLSLHDESS